MNQEDQIIIRRYLLGELDEQDRRQLEERLMTDDAFFDQVMITEEELAEEFADGSLVGTERKQAEQIFLSTSEGRQQINFNLALNRYISESISQSDANQTSPTPFVKPGRITFTDILRNQMPLVAMALAAMVLLAALSAWLVIRSWHAESQLDQLRADQRTTQQQITDLQRERDTAVQQRDTAVQQTDQLQRDNQSKQEENEKLKEQLALSTQPSGINASEEVASDLLRPGRSRGSDDEITVVNITSATKTVRLNLRVPGTDFNRFRAEVEKEGSSAQPVPRRALTSNIRGSETRVTVKLSARSLTSGDYLLTLTPIVGNSSEQIDPNFYRFRIAMK